MVTDIFLQVIKGLKEYGGISSYHLAQKVGFLEQEVRYHLSSLIKQGIVKKEGTKYNLIRTTFFSNGTMVIHIPEEKSFLFLNCEYYTSCGCKNKTTAECRKMKELPKPILKLIKNSL